MRKTVCLMMICLLFAGSVLAADPKPKKPGAQDAARGAAAKPKRKPKPKKPTGPEVVDPAVAKTNPDFSIQGEYLGDGAHGKLGAQVIARDKGAFEIFVLVGGLPGDGWKRGDPRVRLTANRDGDVTTIEGEGMSGKITAGKMTLSGGSAGKATELERIDRKSPALGKTAPKGALVLFDGSGTDSFPEAVTSEDGNLVANATTKETFNNFTLHLEFRLSWKPWATGQARSNSGVYVHDCYEIQVLDSFGLEGLDNECGGIYKIKVPDVNMCLPPLVWQTYDIELVAPKYKPGTEEKVSNARLTLRHNGVLIHEDLELPNGTPGRQKEGPGPRPFYLQGHGNQVQYRNIWVVEEK